MNWANRITVIRIMFVPLFILMYQQYPAWMAAQFPLFDYINRYGVYWAVFTFVIASATDKLDGYIARKYNQVTNLGKLLDPLADKLLVSAALIMLVQYHIIPSWMAVLIIGREVFVSGIRLLAASKGIALAADKHGKIKLVMQVVGITAVLMNNYPFSYMTSFPVDSVLMLLAVLLTIYSGCKYTRNNWHRLNLQME